MSRHVTWGFQGVSWLSQKTHRSVFQGLPPEWRRWKAQGRLMDPDETKGASGRGQGELECFGAAPFGSHSLGLVLELPIRRQDRKCTASQHTSPRHPHTKLSGKGYMEMALSTV